MPARQAAARRPFRQPLRPLAVAALTTLVAACGSEPFFGPGRDNGSSARPDTSSPACQRTSWVAGSVEYCQGTLIYRDYVYDDYGADGGLISPNPTLLNLSSRGAALGSPFATTPGLLSPTAGDQRYPAGLENTADLVKLSLRLDGDRLVIEAELNTLFNPDDAIVAVAIDTDNDPATGGGRWDRLNVSSQGWDVLHLIESGNPDNNTFTLRVPKPAGDTWRVQAAVAQKDGTVMNVAFRGMDETASADATFLRNQFLPGAGNFWEDRQAAALASGDISRFGETVTVADLRNGLTREAPLPTGFHQRVYTSRYTLGEGVDLAGVGGRDGEQQGLGACQQRFNYLGKYQPYGVYVPSDRDPARDILGAQLVLHGCEANHASQINQTGMQRQFGDDLGRILISPLGRGPHGFYSGISERDALDALADVEAHYRIDPDRVFVSGYSMGGFGTLHLATSYPDRFAGAINWVGFTGAITNAPITGTPLDLAVSTLTGSVLDPLLTATVGGLTSTQAAANVINFLGNLQHVPSAHLYATLDELIPVNQALAMAERLQTAGVPYQWFLHPVAEHLTFMILDDWQKEATASADWRRVQRPAQVRYRFDPRFDYPEFELVKNRAYWLSALASRDGGEAEIELNAPGCSDRTEWTFTSVPAAGPSPLPWVGTSRVISGELPVPRLSSLSGNLRNVISAQVDLNDVCLHNQALSFDITSDGDAVLQLSDGRTLRLQAGRNQGSL